MRVRPSTGVLVEVLARQIARNYGAIGSSLPGHMAEHAREIDDDDDAQCERRRTALVSILEHRAHPILDRIVTDTLRATDFAGLGQSVATRYAAIARGSLPVWLDALGAPDPERTIIFDQNTHYVRELIGHGIPKFVQRALVAFGFRLAHGVARDAAAGQGFAPDELADELRVFQRAFEARLFYGT